VGDVLSVFLWIVLVWLVLFVAACMVAVVTLRRTNRVVRSVPTDAPITWLLSVSRPARLHRQLRNLGTWTSQSSTSSTNDAWRQLLDEVVATDARLVVAARANSRVRSGELDAVESAVRRLEDLAVRLRHLDEARDWPNQPAAPSDALEVLEHRIEHLEAAHVDLADLDRRFRSVDPVAPATSPPSSRPSSGPPSGPPSGHSPSAPSSPTTRSKGTSSDTP